jgi:hypothetical protein
VRPHLKNNQAKKSGGMSQVVEHLPSKHETLSLTLSTAKIIIIIIMIVIIILETMISPIIKSTLTVKILISKSHFPLEGTEYSKRNK